MADDKNDKDLKKLLAAAPPPAPDNSAMHRASDAAWNNFVRRGKRTRLRLSFGASPVIASVLVVISLFGVLSYTVTQSTRSGAGDTASETNLISSAQLTQYPAGIRTAVVRMLIGGIAVEKLLFNSPSDLQNAAFTDDEIAMRAVFHPRGGNATWQWPPRDVLSGGTGEWFFNANAQIDKIGITGYGTDKSGNDVVAWLPHVATGICRRMNEEVGLPSVIPAAPGFTGAQLMHSLNDPARPAPAAFPAAAAPVLGGGLSGQPFGCFTTADGVNVYYHVIVER